MSRSRRRHGPLRPVPLTAAVVAAAAVAVVAVVLVSQNGQGVPLRDAADSSAPLEASYQAGTDCPGGAKSYAQPTCSSIVQTPDQFMDTLGAY
jgi:hypothetical protein